MEWMKLPFSLKKEENAGFEQEISENTIMKVLLIGYGSKYISEWVTRKVKFRLKHPFKVHFGAGASKGVLHNSCGKPAQHVIQCRFHYSSFKSLFTIFFFFHIPVHCVSVPMSDRRAGRFSLSWCFQGRG